MDNETLKSWKSWLKSFVAIYDEGIYEDIIIKYKHRFGSDSLKMQLKVIYTAYETLVGIKPDFYTKSSIIDSIIEIRRKELLKSADCIRNINSSGTILMRDIMSIYKDNTEIICDEIRWLIDVKLKMDKQHNIEIQNMD